MTYERGRDACRIATASTPGPDVKVRSTPGRTFSTLDTRDWLGPLRTSFLR
jgi:hypothetical protein